MEVRIRGRGVGIDEHIRSYALRKVDRSARYFGRLREVDINLVEVEPPDRGRRYRAEMSTRTARHNVRAEGEGDTIEHALDAATDRFAQRLRRLGERLTDRRRQGARSPERRGRREEGPSAPAETPYGIPEIVRVGRPSGKPMAPEDAALLMEQQGRSFLVFTNAETGRFAVVYRRNDRRMGLIESD